MPLVPAAFPKMLAVSSQQAKYKASKTMGIERDFSQYPRHDVPFHRHLQQQMRLGSGEALLLTYSC